jgi:hypothetical protein
MTFKVIALAATAILVVSGAGGSETESTDPDPWTGKSRREIVQLLGEPDKTKADRDGVETLTYKFYRVDPAAPPAPAALLIHVPGVGLVARVDKHMTRDADPMQIDPTVLDEQGRRTSGGASPSQSASTSYDPKSGEMSKTWEGLDNPVIKGKATVKFVLDTDDRVVEWSASGKKQKGNPAD